jgi:hypothetical protein
MSATASSEPSRSAGLGEQLAQLVDRALAVPGEVGGALARPGGGEDIGGDAAARLAGAEQFALVGLADGDVGGREVGEDQRAGQRAEVEGGCGAQKSSQISIWKTKSARSSAAKSRSVPNGTFCPASSIFSPQAEARGEPALLVIFAVIGQEGLGHDAEDRAARDRQRAIVEPAVAAQRRADDEHG